MLDHLADRHGLTPSPPSIARLEPVETEIGIVGPLLLGEQDREAVAFGKLRPATAAIVGGSRLGAAVEHDYEPGRRLPRRENEGVELARVGAKAGQAVEPAIVIGMAIGIGGGLQRGERPLAVKRCCPNDAYPTPRHAAAGTEYSVASRLCCTAQRWDGMGEAQGARL